ncbi:hypothetical protein QOZ80_1AG0002540 [Eleusine coracana subsp. coracana]|nr:hypothetical protein QOZ80_1AG0002540 [Eleusine coracana subsp. coracana]
MRVKTFSSATSEWATTVLLAAKDVASPGIHAGGGACFYWLCRRRRGHVVRYDAARGRASLVWEPPETEGSDGRVWLSLDSAGGRPRVCMFDVFDEERGNALPHEDVEGVHGVWVLEEEEEDAWWRCVHEGEADDMSMWYFKWLHGHELAVDYAGACRDYILLEKSSWLMRYDLETGDKVDLACLHGKDGKLYDRFRAFPLFV